MLFSQLESEPELEQIGKSLEEPPFDIPNKWKWMQLKHLVKVIGGTSYKSADVIKSGVRIIRGGNLRDFSIQIRDDDVFLPVSFASDEKTVHQSDIVIVSSTGSKEVIGRPAVLKSNIKCQIGAFLRIIRPVVEEYSDYLKVIFQSDYYRNHIRATVSGTNINNVKNSYIENFYIPVPPIEEQRRIVECIQKLRPLVDAYQDAEKELESIEAYFPVKLKASILQEAIQGKLVPQLESEPIVTQVGAKPQDVPFIIPNKWKWVQLKTVGKVIGGGTPRTNVPEYWDNGDIPWFTPADLGKITSIYVGTSARKITAKGLANSSAIRMPRNSVLFSSRAPIGYIALAEEACCTNQGCKSFVANESFIMPMWAYWVLKARTPDIVSRASGTTFKEISGRGMGDTWIPLPPIPEQNRIITRIKELFDIAKVIQ